MPHQRSGALGHHGALCRASHAPCSDGFVRLACVVGQAAGFVAVPWHPQQSRLGRGPASRAPALRPRRPVPVQCNGRGSRGSARNLNLSLPSADQCCVVESQSILQACKAGRTLVSRPEALWVVRTCRRHSRGAGGRRSPPRHVGCAARCTAQTAYCFRLLGILDRFDWEQNPSGNRRSGTQERMAPPLVCRLAVLLAALAACARADSEACERGVWGRGPVGIGLGRLQRCLWHAM